MGSTTLIRKGSMIVFMNINKKRVLLMVYGLFQEEDLRKGSMIVFMILNKETGVVGVVKAASR
jgi:aromatic ring-opening dioxygenase LigB subunit